MKLKDFRKLEYFEVAVVVDPELGPITASMHNVEGGMCDCCGDPSIIWLEVFLVRNAVTGEITYGSDEYWFQSGNDKLQGDQK